MKYMGSKAKIAQYIVPIIQDYIIEHHCHTYVEPFCGGCNVIDKIVCVDRVGCDKQVYLIAMLQNLDKIPTLPDAVSYEHYSDVRNSYNKRDSRYPDWYIGAIGFLSSYNGRFFDGGYSGVRTIKDGSTRDYYAEAKRNLIAQIPALDGIEFIAGDYKDTCSDFRECLIYCDPPYLQTKQYRNGIDYTEFWDWCKKMARYNTVLVSESAAPDNVTCIWEKPIKRTIDIHSTKTANEKLFLLC